MYNLETLELIGSRDFQKFALREFVNPSTCLSLLDTFPDVEDIGKSDAYSPGKVTLDESSPRFRRFMSENREWRSLYDFFQAKKWHIVDMCCRNTGFKDVSHFMRIVNLCRKTTPGRVFRRFAIGRNIDIGIRFEFSVMRGKGSIPPHADTEKKVLTLMMYFPEASQEGSENMGTTFLRRNVGGVPADYREFHRYGTPKQTLRGGCHGALQVKRRLWVRKDCG